MNVSVACIAAAVVIFALAACSVSIGVPLVPLGLALFAAGHLPNLMSLFGLLLLILLIVVIVALVGRI